MGKAREEEQDCTRKRIMLSETLRKREENRSVHRKTDREGGHEKERE